MPLEHAILAFIDQQPLSGYDLKKEFDASVAHFWTATQSHIYKALEGLEKKGWAQMQPVAQEGKPTRKEYHITPAGSAELRRWLTTPLPADPVRQSMLIQIFFSHGSSNDEIAALLQSRLQEVNSRLHNLGGAVQDTIENCPLPSADERNRRLWQVTLDYGLSYYSFERAWLEKTLQFLRSLPPPQTPA